MHVLIPVLHRPEKPTGVCRHAVNLAQGLAERAEVTRITLIIGAWQQDYFSSSFDLKADKINLIEIDIKNSSVSRNLWFLFGLPRLAKQLQPDIIHLSFPFPFIRQWFSVPVVATIHDLYPFECPENFGYPQVWFNQGFLHQCISQSDGLSCVSKTTLQALERYFPKASWGKSLTVIYNSVDFQATSPTKPQQLSLEDRQPFFLSVAQHRKHKTLDSLIRAYARLREQHQISPEARLILVGSPGPETASLHQLINALKLQKHIQLVSGLTNGELRWLYENASCFVIPSATEGFCMPLLEAQALGCRTVCSDIPIFREVVGHHGHYFSLENSPLDNLTMAIEKALAHPDPPQSFLHPQFLQETVTQNYLDFYRSV
jgi:glycosyltransferase involved in cell wall biosynthesis